MWLNCVGVTTWEKPIELLLESEKSSGAEWFWVKHETLCYVPAQRIDKATNLFECDGHAFKLDAASYDKVVGPSVNVKESTTSFDDMVLMSDVHEPRYASSPTVTALNCRILLYIAI